jgi:hypothetical protein
MPVKVFASILISLAAYLVLWALKNASITWLIAALLPLVCGLGLFFRRGWAAYLWYVLAVGSSIWWLGSVIYLAVQGWPVEGRAPTIISLLPGAFLLAACLAGSIVVRRQARAGGFN